MNDEPNAPAGAHPKGQDWPRNTWLEIDLAVLENNLRVFKTNVGVDVLAVVKANGYGHGLAEAAEAFVRGGAAMLGVATIGEAAALRAAGLRTPILLMSAFDPTEAAAALRLGADVMIGSGEDAAALAAIARQAGRAARAHLEVDTGMARLGCRAGQAVDVLRAAAALDGLSVVGLSTHFWGADLPDMSGAQAQAAAFGAVVLAAREAGLCPPLVHAANSPASLRLPEARHAMTRGGVALYGYEPDEGVALPAGMAPALAWRGRVALVRELQAGEGVGYGHEYIAAKRECIAVLNAGYADGFRRAPKNVNRALIGGVERRIVGRVCMDQCFALVDDDVRAGDPFTLIGAADGLRISVEDVAGRWGTNIYDVMACISPRVPRRYL